MSSTSVSVIIPSYNSAHLVGQAIESALAQTLSPAQIIVVDDGSTDDTPQRLQPYESRGVLCVRQQNQGVSAARNVGIERATGELIAFLDADDVWHPQKLKIQARILAERPDLAMLGAQHFSWPGQVPEIMDTCLDSVTPVRWKDLVVRNQFTASSVIVRRSALGRAGSPIFDTDLHGPEDYDLWLRIARDSKVANAAAPLTGYRRRTAGLGSQPHTMEAGIARILRKLDQNGTWLEGGSFLRRRAHASFRFSCALMYRDAGHPAIAIRRALRSVADYPFRIDAHLTSFARLRFVATTLLRMPRNRVRAAEI